MVQTQCLHQLFGICFVAPPEIGEGGIFRYSDFITALALLVLVYTFSDARTQFRLAIAPTVRTRGSITTFSVLVIQRVCAGSYVLFKKFRRA